ncbi:uncharacterized protein PITG_22699 [Phytophthora infestans T30-4]|uniref:Secreted RxLR effector peptide protein n=2 Tax=Phytophthora infestans TaxID=4787 RepID=D0MW85_PHYIT|nr:uncharacterized protein PITG_22699 [Phytophthora infestans T30-4]EEY63898.1 conserved hypothetical protein [Phytophthora infestans T30-4]KAF4137667.1 hypothetical protein GN958_ATG13179 [Phytophthora infestans]|eukprot:XP_002907334.1 conserved hypothetical protein [Phytophthora infestans T30-4]
MLKLPDMFCAARALHLVVAAALAKKSEDTPKEHVPVGATAFNNADENSLDRGGTSVNDGDESSADVGVDLVGSVSDNISLADKTAEDSWIAV